MHTPMPCRMPEALAGLLLAAALLSGCSTTPPMAIDNSLLPPNPPATLGNDTGNGSGPGGQQKTVDEQLTELEEVLASSTASFSLGKGDVLSISVYDEPDLTLDSVPVRPDGSSTSCLPTTRPTPIRSPTHGLSLIHISEPTRLC